MDVAKEQKIKAQEWVVMFDGQIKRNEKEIDANEHHLKVNKESKDWIEYEKYIHLEIEKKYICIDVLNVKLCSVNK